MKIKKNKVNIIGTSETILDILDALPARYDYVNLMHRICAKFTSWCTITKHCDIRSVRHTSHSKQVQFLLSFLFTDEAVHRCWTYPSMYSDVVESLNGRLRSTYIIQCPITCLYGTSVENTMFALMSKGHPVIWTFFGLYIKTISKNHNQTSLENDL